MRHGIESLFALTHFVSLFEADIRTRATKAQDGEAAAKMEDTEEAIPLRSRSEDVEDVDSVDELPLSVSQARQLYVSHALSTWNERVYEFSGILFTASAFPSTLLASSIRGLFLQCAALLFSPTIGAWIDNSRSRLSPLLVTINGNRISILTALVFWYWLLDENTSAAMKPWLFLAAVLFGVCERMSGIGNMISMERDWVPVIADQPNTGELNGYSLTHLNAVMRRIDLICKLVSPIVTSLVVIVFSLQTAILAIAAVNILSWGIEIWSINRVWRGNARVRAEKHPSPAQEVESSASDTLYARLRKRLFSGTKKQLKQLKFYFSTDVWMPSLALALLHINVLSYRDTFITYLLSTGFSLTVIAIARTCGTVIEVSSTFIAPMSIRRLAETRQEEITSLDEEILLDEAQKSFDRKHDVGLTRSGLWGITFQFMNLLPVVLAIWALSSVSTSDFPEDRSLLPRVVTLLPTSTPSVSWAIIMFTFLSFSRLGLWVYDLTTQEITQTHVSAIQRSSFTGIEMSFCSGFELSQYVVSSIVNRPGDFRWIATGSVAFVGLSTFIYTSWVWRQRGHLVHWDSLGKAALYCTRSKS